MDKAEAGLILNNPKINDRSLEYLDLNIPKTDHKFNKETNSHIYNACNFKTDKNIGHVWHNNNPTWHGKQLNTIIDLIINLSEHLNESDKEILRNIKNSGQSSNTIEILNNIQRNLEYIQTQQKEMHNRITKTLDKADKFPSKKEIQSFTEEIKSLFKIPIQLEETIIRLQKRQAEIDSSNMEKIIRMIKRLRDLNLGYDGDEVYPIE